LHELTAVDWEALCAPFRDAGTGEEVKADAWGEEPGGWGDKLPEGLEVLDA